MRARGDKHPELKPRYAALKQILASQYILYLALWGGLFTTLYLGLYNYLWLDLLLIVPLFYLHLQLKNCVRTIGMDIILKDFNDDALRQKTLYQISEFYSRQYQVPSLVDNIFLWDNATRMIVIAAAILAGQMIPLIMKIYRINFIFTFLCLLAGCYLIFTTIHTFIIYKHLQKP